ncbi:hypothetical protein VNI00_010781 [Paramarasmius palmivorus]|uniref:Uncharacterized protein n=1 Tax=Paramarasmius palmivorus TaxID=297713 RepID=A0AAW0CHW3_9AGAR
MADRSPSAGPPPARQQAASRSQSRRARSRTPRSISASSAGDSDAGPARQQSRGNNRRRRRGAIPGLDDGAGDVGKQVANAAGGGLRTLDEGDEGGGQPGGGEQPGGGGDSGSKPLKIRLDLNLDVAVELKAKVHGDLSLSLLR